MQGRLGTVGAAVVVRVGSRTDKQGDRLWSGRELARPVGGDVQGGAPTALEAFAADHAHRGELWSLSEQATESTQVPAADS